MGLIKAGIFLYGAHLVAKNFYGDKNSNQREVAPGQSPPPDYTPSHSSQGYSPNYHQQGPPRSDFESGPAPKTCTCGAVQQKETYAPVNAQNHKY